MTFIHEDFLLESDTAQDLYHSYAASQPIIDYHCHLNPADLAANRRFNCLYDIWLAGDHYKWRAMRLNGEADTYRTGEAKPYDQFLAYARTVPYSLRNPLYHWTHLELKRYFNIDTLLNEKTAPAIWEEANEALADDALSTWGILEKFKVEMIGTTDDPTEDLQHHKQLEHSGCPARVLPTFRPDRAVAIENSTSWNEWTDELATVSGLDCSNLEQFQCALTQRIEYFNARGCVASDHGLPACPQSIASTTEAAATFGKARCGQALSNQQADAFMGYMLCWLGERYTEKEWVMQLHLGAIRNVNQAVFKHDGSDAGCDSIDDRDQIKGLALMLGELSARDKLPKTILYNLDPAKNYAFATMCGNFFEAGVPSKVQFGSGWWFLDQLEGMTQQLNALSNLGLLARFIGMLTDSRSFMSYPRHEYFRRLLCNLLGQDIESGRIPADAPMQNLINGICHHNAKAYFKL
ncbi:MAG: Uronate isomerase [Opitutia bacterium UBA7350]|nr:MAG: Uronate isomerase [Opitutae bacterium UBA7350]